MHWPLEKFGTIHDLALTASWNSDQLSTEIKKRAGRLVELDVGPRCLVAIAHRGSASFIADLFAVWACGAAAVLLDPALTRSEMDNLVQFIDPLLALSDKNDPGLVPGVTTYCLDGSDARFAGLPAGEVSDLALVLVTSGTTGAPKAV